MCRTVLVKVDMERPQTNDSTLSHSSRLSLPPLTTPPITPTVETRISSGNSNKKVRWKLLKKNKRATAPRPSLTLQQLGLEASKTWKEMDKIESLPSVPQMEVEGRVEQSTPLFKRRPSNDIRPRSAKSTFGEIWHMEATNADIQKRTVFFIHGVGGCFQMWKHQIRCLSEYGYEVVAFDMIGHGKSSVARKSKEYSFQCIQQDFTALFDRYAKDTNIIIAHSYGTCFAVLVARSRPKRVSHLVLVSSGAPIPLSPESLPLSYIPDKIFRCFAPLIRRNFARHAFHTIPSEQDFNLSFGADLAVVKRILNGQEWAEGDFSYHRMIGAQTLLIYGCEDGFVTLDEMQQMRRAIPDSHLEVVENASHMVMLESPDQVNNLILDFVQLPVQGPSDMETSAPVSRRASLRPQSSMSRVLPHVKLLSL